MAEKCKDISRNKIRNYASLYFKNAYFRTLVCVNFPSAAKSSFLMYVVEGDIFTAP